MMLPGASAVNENKSEAGPVTAHEQFCDGSDTFQDGPSFDFEFLAKVGRKNLTKGNLSRQSLFVKFDPLVGAAESPCKEMNSTFSKDEKVAGVESGATPKKSSLEVGGEEKLIAITPPRNDITSPRPRPTGNTATTPNTLRQDILSREISKLQELMIQQEQSYEEQLTSRTEENEALRKRLEEMESREPRGDLEERLKATEAANAKLKKENAELTLGKKQLTMIMEEYEKTISQLVTKREDEKKEFEKEKEAIANERDTTIHHLSNMEVAFNDIHQKYEKAKSVIEALRSNEKSFKECLEKNKETIKKQHDDYLKLKAHASEKLEAANQELSELKKDHQFEVAKLQALAKKAELRVKSLEESVEQKQKEITELSQICDELIARVERR